jgi:hypothetical protein
VKRLERDVGADALTRLRRDGVGDVCPYCCRGHLEPMKEAALLGIKRPEKSELYPCIIISCSWCGHIALFDSSFHREEIDQPDLPSNRYREVDLGREAGEGGRSGSEPSGLEPASSGHILPGQLEAAAKREV